METFIDEFLSNDWEFIQQDGPWRQIENGVWGICRSKPEQRILAHRMKSQPSDDSVPQYRLQSAVLGFPALPTEVGTAERCRRMAVVEVNAPMLAVLIRPSLPSLPLLRFRARFAAERVMRQEPVALQPDDHQVAWRQFHVGRVPLVARDHDGKAVNLRVINQREGARLLRIRLGLGARTTPQHEARYQPFTVADVGNVFDHGATERVGGVEQLRLKIEDDVFGTEDDFDRLAF